ncbi:protoporphyrinogen oxidase [Pseudonocardia eucalypti]|uniref:Protoporphyrinogen oxidase n=1 Tax=Pseudonocardia eucalypti TaxID=648755 RepID=A0ABP9RB12_9PSEU|nr:oxygen-dependent protoporphyrinogen oxidase [Pseudonocardia eucalypti]
MPTAAVVGAGLSGLTAAHRLSTAGWSVRVFEAAPRVGGRTVSDRIGGYLVDGGASALGASYRAYLDLVAEVGLTTVPSSPYIGIYRDGRIHHLRLDRLVRSALGTRVLSARAKLRAVRLAVDLVRARAAGYLDYSDMRRSAPLDTETARDYALRALDAELEEYLCGPVVRCMLIAGTDRVSRVELFSGLANIFSSRIHALVGGQGRLAEELAGRLDVALSDPVERVADLGHRVAVTHSGTADEFDACVVSAPLPVAREICPDRAAVLGPLHDALGYTQAITVAVGTRIAPDSPAMLVQMPAKEDPDIALLFLEHHKAPDRAPPGHGLIGCDWDTAAAEKWMGATDEEIVEHTLASLRRVFPELFAGAADPVELTHVTRWRHALPLTSVGAYRHIGEFNAALDPADRIQFAGDYMSAAGQNTAVEFGTRAAHNLLSR